MGPLHHRWHKLQIEGADEHAYMQQLWSSDCVTILHVSDQACQASNMINLSRVVTAFAWQLPQ